MKTVVKSALPLLTVLLIFCSFGTFVGTARAASMPSSGLLPGIIGGFAYAGSLQGQAGSSSTNVSPLSLASLGCAISAKTVTASAASTQLRNFAISGPVTDSATTSRTTSSATVQASSNVENVNILGGLITAVRANAVANTAATTTNASSSATSTLVGLRIAGIPMLFNPSPNTTIPLPGLGSVTLNEQSAPVSDANTTSISVTALDIKVTLQNDRGLPVGTKIVIASAMTSFTRTSILATVAAGAYGLDTAGNVGPGSISSGPWALATIDCTGGNSLVTVANVNVPGIGGSMGTMTDTASGQISAAGAHAQSSSTIRQMSLFTSMITAAIVATTAQASSDGTASATTTLYNATVAGVLLPNHPGPNTRIPIADLGFVIVNEQSVTVTSGEVLVQVNAFDLHVTVANSSGLPVGTDIIIGHSHAEVIMA